MKDVNWPDQPVALPTERRSNELIPDRGDRSCWRRVMMMYDSQFEDSQASKLDVFFLLFYVTVMLQVDVSVM